MLLGCICVALLSPACEPCCVAAWTSCLTRDLGECSGYSVRDYLVRILLSTQKLGIRRKFFETSGAEELRTRPLQSWHLALPGGSDLNDIPMRDGASVNL